MNILFGALLIVLLLLPGSIFRFVYLNILHGRKTFQSSFVEELFFSVIPTILFQVCGILVVNRFTRVDIKTIYLLLINSEHAMAQPNFDVDKLTTFFLYLLAVYLVSGVTGWLVRLVVQKNNWDIRMPFLRLHNEWYYALKGFVTEEAEGKRKFVAVDNVWLDVLLEVKEATYIYSGFLSNFFLSRDEGLDRIHLSQVRRRRLGDDKPANTPGEPKGEVLPEQKNQDELVIGYSPEDEQSLTSKMEEFVDERYYFMPGDVMVIPFKEIRNINITYYIEEEVQTPQPNQVS